MRTRPAAAPTAQMIAVSANCPRTIDALDAPSEARNANSPRRSRTRHNVRFARLVQPISSSDNHRRRENQEGRSIRAIERFAQVNEVDRELAVRLRIVLRDLLLDAQDLRARVGGRAIRREARRRLARF